MINGKIHYKWSFSIVMLVYQRVQDLLVTSLLFAALLNLRRAISQTHGSPPFSVIIHDAFPSVNTPSHLALKSQSEGCLSNG